MISIKTAQRLMFMAAIATSVAFASPGYSQTKPSASAIATAKEIIGASGATMLFNPLVAGVVEQAKLLFLQQDPGLNKDLTEIANNMRTELQPRLAEVTDEMARSYANAFTEPELQAILTFYRSPAGKKLIDQQPKVAEDSMRFAQDWANKLSDDVVKKMREELKKRGHAM
jgi:hypothetical protein